MHIHLATAVAVAVLMGNACRAQLTYQLGNTLLNIDVVVDSSRVNIPWEILWGPDDRLWMTDGPLITRWDPVTDELDTLLDRGYGNGLGMTLHPDFPDTPIIMAVFDTADYYGNGHLCEVSRFNYDEVNDVITDETVLFTYYHAGEHGGGRLLFDTTGHVLLTTADYYLNGPDTLFSTNGKTLRFATDGSVPPDNPRADHTWTWGHRNPQGLAMLPNGAIVNSEHGQMFEANEINLLQRNEDHGYPYYDGTACFLFPDTCSSGTYNSVAPISTFTHPPAGCEFYTSNAIPEMHDKLITGILWHKGLMLFCFNDDLDTVLTEEYLEGGPFDVMWRIRDIAIRPDGTFYLITNDRMDARIRWIHPDINTGLTDGNPTELRLSPNPVLDELAIKVDPRINPSRIEVMDAQGRSIISLQTARYGPTTINTEQWNSGLYLVRVFHEEGVVAQRFIKR